MSCCTATSAGAVTMAASVAKLTVATTPSIVLSFFSTRAAHDAQVIPWTDNFISWGADDASPVTAVDDTEVILFSSKNVAHHSAGPRRGPHCLHDGA